MSPLTLSLPPPPTDASPSDVHVGAVNGELHPSEEVDPHRHGRTLVPLPAGAQRFFAAAAAPPQPAGLIVAACGRPQEELPRSSVNGA